MNDADRIEATRRLLEKSVRESGAWLSGDGRVGEDIAAKLLGFNAGSLANKRAEGTAPRWYKLGGSGHKVTYRLEDLARFIERHRVEY